MATLLHPHPTSILSSPLTVPHAHTKQHDKLIVKALLAAVAVIVLLAVLVRGFGLSQESLEGDEIFTYKVATASGSDALRIIKDDLVHPPFYYYLVRWCMFGFEADPFGLRALSLIAGISTIALIAYMGYVFREIRGPAVFAALLLSINDTHIFFSQQARSYALYTLLVCALLFWSWLIDKYQANAAFWCIGSVLMTILVYTHYVATIYVACVVLGTILSAVSRKAKLAAVYCGITAAVALIPWIALEYGTYINKKGLNQNLGWQSTPTLYELKAIWANFVGIPQIPGGTTLVLVASAGIICLGLILGRSQMTPFGRTFLITTGLTAIVPPCVLFLISVKPISLPLFGYRHLLPSAIPWLMLVGHGLWTVTARFNTRRQIRFLGVALFAALQSTLALASLQTLPRRVPSQSIATDIKSDPAVYTTYTYGIGEPVSYYLKGAAKVQRFPSDKPHDLPDSFVVIYRPWVEKELRQLDVLNGCGWEITEHKDYKRGNSEQSFVTLVRFKHTRCIS